VSAEGWAEIGSEEGGVENNGEAQGAGIELGGDSEIQKAAFAGIGEDLTAADIKVSASSK